MQVTMMFNFPEDKEELEHAQRGYDYYLALIEISQRIFRPARKHGYSDPAMNELLENSETAQHFIASLEAKFWDILKENDITI